MNSATTLMTSRNTAGQAILIKQNIETRPSKSIFGIIVRWLGLFDQSRVGSGYNDGAHTLCDVISAVEEFMVRVCGLGV